MSACAEYNKAMQELTGVNYNTGEQNNDMAKAKQARDWRDTLAAVQYIQEINPFSPDPTLRNIATGVHTHTTVNVITAKNVGTKILQSMDGKTAAEYTFKKKDQVVTFNTKSSVKIDGDEVQVDPQLLFQTLIIVAQTSDELELAFKYELCSHPPPLFNALLMLREPHKPALADAIWDLFPPDVPEIPADFQYVLDGGALVQRIPWSRRAIYKDIFNTYTEYVMRKYCEAIVVFDGYEGTSTKDINHQKRSNGKAGATVTFTVDMRTTMKKDQFLGNKQNKQCFIRMLAKELEKKNCETYHASRDADVLIVKKQLRHFLSPTLYWSVIRDLFRLLDAVYGIVRKH